jgi:hypothetical protein
MSTAIADADVAVLRRAGVSPEDVEHSVRVARKALDIITDGRVRTEPEAEERFEEILATNVRYGKNPTTLARYLGYHREIQGVIGKENHHEC